VKHESRQDVQKWFLAQATTLWPLAVGCLSLRKNRCIRPRCSACHSGEGHPSYALSLRRGGAQTVVYVPDDLVDSLAKALANGKTLQALLQEAGLRYLAAMKAERRKP